MARDPARVRSTCARWSPERARKLPVDVMDPFRQMGYDKPLLNQFHKPFHTRNFFFALSLLMALWNWLWKSCGSRVELRGRPRGAIRLPDATRDGRSPDRRSATPRRSPDRPPGLL